MSTRAIDCLVNVHFGETEKQPEFMLKVRDDYFKGPQSLYDQVELAQLLEEMDERGVEKAILMDNLTKPSVTARKFVDQRPDKFALAMGGVNLLRPCRRCENSPPSCGICRWRIPQWGPAFGATANTRRATQCITRSTPNALSSGCRCA